jgi:hypothetical protein
MLSIYPTESEIEEVMQKLFPEREDAVRDTWTKPRAEVMALYEHGVNNNLPGMEGTGWSLYNSVGEWSDYGKNYRSEESRFVHSMEGSGMDLKEKAFQYVMALS